MRIAVPIALAASLAGVPPAHAAWPTDPATNVPLCTAANGQQFPVAVSDGAGGALVAWWDLRGGAQFDVYAHHVLASGTVDPAWPAGGRAVCAWGGDQQYPAITGDGAGGALVAWCDARAGAFDVYVQHVLANGATDPAWPAGGRAVCTAPGAQWFPVLASDGGGGAWLAWVDERAGELDVYAHHVLAGGAPDPAWPANGAALGAGPGAQDGVQVVSLGAAGALFVWADARGGTTFDIVAQRLLANGAPDPAWPAGGRVLCAAPSHQLGVRAVGDGAGGMVAAWQDARAGGEYDVYAQRVLADGTLASGWPGDGRALCTAPLDQTEVRLATDGAGGAIVAWTDARGGWDSGVYVQHVRGDGAADPAWPANGRAACDTAGFQHSPELVADGVGGAVIVWADSRGGSDHDLYAQHLHANGTADPAWPANGRAVSTGSGDQQHAVLVPGPAPIAVWDDFRAGNFDVYAQAATPPPAAGAGVPELLGAADVKPDQGGVMHVRWRASALDAAPALGVTDYRVWRDGGDGWRVVARRAAAQAAEYAADVPTTGDSTAAGVPVQRFRVEARGDTLDPAQHWFSAPDSGWSVDDLAPAAPLGFGGDYSDGLTELAWAASPEADLAAYRLYRGEDAAFTPSPARLVAQTANTFFTDMAGGAHVYKLTAVDVHGNESPWATFLPANTADAGGERARDFLARAGAHPARGAAGLRFGVAAAGPVVLAIHDAAGRRVRTLADGVRPAGAYALAWDGRDDAGRAVRAGLYFARLEAGGRVRSLRLVLLP